MYEYLKRAFKFLQSAADVAVFLKETSLLLFFLIPEHFVDYEKLFETLFSGLSTLVGYRVHLKPAAVHLWIYRSL